VGHFLPGYLSKAAPFVATTLAAALMVGAGLVAAVLAEDAERSPWSTSPATRGRATRRPEERAARHRHDGRRRHRPGRRHAPSPSNPRLVRNGGPGYRSPE